MLCRDCHLEWIVRAEGATLEERVASVGSPVSDARVMRELFAARGDQAKLFRLSRRHRLDEFAKLKRGWRNGDGERVPQKVLAWAYRWVAEADDDELAHWRVYPHVDGGLRFERYDGQFGVHDDSICVLADKIVYHFTTWSPVDCTVKRIVELDVTIEVAFEPPHKTLLVEVAEL